MTDTESIVTIEPMTVAGTSQWRGGLIELLIDAVSSGASVGFLDPLSTQDAADYWDAVFSEWQSGKRLLFVVRDGERVIGSVQLLLPHFPNAMHRAEVQKLMVHSSARRRGLGTALLMAVEDEAITRGRHLLVLDSRAGDPAGKLYDKLGYVRAGVIPGFAQSLNGRLHTTAIYYRDLRDHDGAVLGDNDAPTRKPR
jgi:ribosomal protein S18 acetylase RimI-like enzyme